MADEYHEAEEKRNILRRVAAYRDLCNRVRGSSMGSLVFGSFMLAMWNWLLPDAAKFQLYGLIFLSLALLEFATGLLNRFHPSAEGVLLEGFVLVCFGGWNVIREALIWQGAFPGRPNTILIVLGGLWLYKGAQMCRSYMSLARHFADRPSFEHLRWFDQLIREIHDADPRTDPLALVLPTDPSLSIKLLGDTAFIVFPDGEVEIIAREELMMDVVPGAENEKPRCYLSIRGNTLPPFPLGRANWENYLRWKAEGIEELPEARPIR